METDILTMVHLFKDSGFQFIIVLFTTVLSHFETITIFGIRLKYQATSLALCKYEVFFSAMTIQADGIFFLFGTWRGGKYEESYLLLCCSG